MELNEKLQELRKKRGLTQEELAKTLHVSRTAISKWESGRGIPSIESLRAISVFFSVSLDDLLSSDKLLSIVSDEQKQKESHTRDMIFGLFDSSCILLMFLPLFGLNIDGVIYSVSLLALSDIALYLKIMYFSIICAISAFGIATLALQSYTSSVWLRTKSFISLGASTACLFIFILSRQPYVAALVLLFLMIKAIICIKRT